MANVTKAKIEAFETALENDVGDNRDARTCARLALGGAVRISDAIAKGDVDAFAGSLLNASRFYDDARMLARGVSEAERKRRADAARNMILYGNIVGIDG